MQKGNYKGIQAFSISMPKISWNAQLSINSLTLSILKAGWKFDIIF